jgi:hypothetical protein
MRRLSPLRYFTAVSPPSPPLVAVLGILATVAAALEILDRGSSDWVLASVVLMQLFASSTGFRRHATRGYFDPILLGTSRARVALAHLTVSATPGFLAWTAAGIAEAVAARSLSVPAFRPAGWAALLLASAVPWAASVRTAPFLGGTLWLVVSVSLLISGRIPGLLALLHAQPAWANEHPVAALLLGLAFPFVVPSLTWPPGVLVGFAAAALLAAAAGVLAVSKADFALAEEGS